MGLIEKIEAARIKTDRPDLKPGDTVEVSVRVIEGDKERQQKFRGEVINIRGGGLRRTFTVRKISEGIGVERTFPIHGPSVGEIKVVKHSNVRRAKLFYLRKKTGKAARLAEKKTITETGGQKTSAEKVHTGKKALAEPVGAK
jgi:large subunit ribosomal protein L19